MAGDDLVEQGRVQDRTGTGPPWSRELEKATMPYRDTAPYVGLTPTVPVTAAGWRMEPPVSVPIASGAW